jgi:hypothetical protein
VINLHYDRKWGSSPGQVLNYLAMKQQERKASMSSDTKLFVTEIVRYKGQ